MIGQIVLAALLAASFLSAACSTAHDPQEIVGGDDVESSCTSDTTVSCAAGASGFACQPGENPEDEDSTIEQRSQLPVVRERAEIGQTVSARFFLFVTANGRRGRAGTLR